MIVAEIVAASASVPSQSPWYLHSPLHICHLGSSKFRIRNYRSAVRDSSLQIREGAAEAVRSVLEIIAERDSRHNTIWYER